MLTYFCPLFSCNSTIAENAVGIKIPIIHTIQILPILEMEAVLVIRENQKEEDINSKFLILGQE